MTDSQQLCELRSAGKERQTTDTDFFNGKMQKLGDRQDGRILLK